ncbi:hypothetical protein [Pantoea agglomerans]|uniref:hypothetical protein n=1 Tax=Enterobacter agglomerans TaxID=549 RepID=UPI003C7B7D3B
MNTHNVNTAASESTETWVKQNFDVHLAARTNRRFSLAKLEGDLMKHRAMEKLGVDTEDLFDDLQMAASCISTMIDRGDIVTPSGYGISISKDKVNEPIVDYDQIMKMPNLHFYVRLPGEYPVVKLNLKYRKQKKYHPAMIERDFHDRLSPELERIIESNERSSRAANISFPTGEEILEDDNPATATSGPASVPVSSAAAPLKAQPPEVRPTSHAERAVVAPVPAVMAVAARPEPETVGDTPPPSNVRPFPQRTVPAPAIAAEAEPLPAKPTAAETSPETVMTPPAPARPIAPSDTGREASPPETLKPVVRPLMKSKPSGPSALDMLARRKSQAASESSESNAEEAVPQEGAAQGEAPELNMQMEKDDGGRLIVRHISPRKTDQEKRDEADARQYSDANARMADDEKNILRHRDDYDAYQEMSDSLDPGGYER